MMDSFTLVKTYVELRYHFLELKFIHIQAHKLLTNTSAYAGRFVLVPHPLDEKQFYLGCFLHGVFAFARGETRSHKSAITK